MLSDIWSRGQLSDWLQITEELRKGGVHVPQDAVLAVQAVHDKMLPLGKKYSVQVYRHQVICGAHAIKTVLRPCGTGYFCPDCLDESELDR